jgi:GLPGLI family protein
MNKILTILLVISSLASAQNHRFVYEYKYIPNSKEKDTIRKDMMALDITEKGSIYQSLSKLEYDSIQKAKFIAKLKKNTDGGFVSVSFGGGGGKKESVTEIVTKTYPNYDAFLSTFIDGTKYKVSDNKKIDWKIGTETQKIMNYTAQKATTTFGGRDWIAWFTTDLPFPDGPYKFHGLPGLIVKLEDSTGSHSMTMVANKKVNPKVEEEGEQDINGTKVSFGIKEIAVNEDQFKKTWKSYIKDPAKEIRQNGEGTSFGNEHHIFVYEDANGNKLKINDVIKDKENSVKKMLETNNNRIEPTLYN